MNGTPRFLYVYFIVNVYIYIYILIIKCGIIQTGCEYDIFKIIIRYPKINSFPLFYFFTVSLS